MALKGAFVALREAGPLTVKSRLEEGLSKNDVQKRVKSSSSGKARPYPWPSPKRGTKTPPGARVRCVVNHCPFLF
jgi:hypothetical protein